MSGWSCPYEVDGECRRRARPCQPGERGCVLRGRVRFVQWGAEAAPAEPGRDESACREGLQAGAEP